MYIVDAFWSIVPGNERAAIGALEALAQQVQDTEPDTWMYLLHTPNLDPGINIYPPPAPVQVAFVEGFKNRDAYLRHRETYKQFIQQHGSLFLNMYGPTAPFRIAQAMELAVGFIRPEAAEPTVFQVEARWSMKPGTDRDKVKAALEPYVAAVKAKEPLTYMYTVSFTDDSPHSPSIPPLQPWQVTYNSSWKDHDAFVAHTKEPVYQEFLKKSGHLFVQAVPGQETHPYMTTSVLKRFAGFFRPEAFVG
jgi:quinol monooxygenase YgiN